MYGVRVIAATDNNPGSVNLARKIREIAEAAERQDLGIIDHRPDTEGHDWNDVQRALAPQPKPSASPAGTTGHANLAIHAHDRVHRARDPLQRLAQQDGVVLDARAELGIHVLDRTDPHAEHSGAQVAEVLPRQRVGTKWPAGVGGRR